jgi:hypothetical protein
MKWQFGQRHRQRQMKLALEFAPEPLRIPREKWKKPYGFTGNELSPGECARENQGGACELQDAGDASAKKPADAKPAKAENG